MCEVCENFCPGRKCGWVDEAGDCHGFRPDADFEAWLEEIAGKMETAE